ncbi:endonuclease/exonuclease/phosphatase family metal-dependent hydrolase [Kribbella aluminosa]|uniref:Endonuclease/exonuclease/phosphatase family metal-dependent hydrolase n=1 Tax=Kribbella aluminosa TaxID=416017 RepID=A0ABS4UWT0_9ACTN|nr:endonuclease/exonuclease/phosphatase family protein [Kribbella aluminosa]MBP2356113.1 endonuclease/exonuclease/phosphatase family metal-dependent hydrolase [Kribbella aluminosa]
MNQKVSNSQHESRATRLEIYDGPLGPTTFTVMTMNLWGSNHWDERREGVAALMRARRPDVLCVQELTAWSRQVIDESLVGHRRAEGPHPGWERASNIWWRADLFECEGQGVEDIDELGDHRGLFWVRLRPLTGPDRDVVVATAHLTWQGDTAELHDLRNRRVPQARQICEHLDRLAAGGPVVFSADLNDVSPAQYAMAGRGFCDAWAALGQGMPATSPVPASLSYGGLWDVSKQLVRVATGFDVQFSKGAVRVRGAEVVDFYHLGRAVSDHFPVQATYTLGI